MLGSLLRQGLIQIDGETHRVTDLAYETLGLAVPTASIEPIKAASRTRENTKQAQIIAMLQRTEGATISQIVEATGWQPHYAEAQIMPMSIGNPASCMAITTTESA